MEIEQLIQALIDGEISPAEFKRQAQEVELPAPPRLPPWMDDNGATIRNPPPMPAEPLPWENLPAWIDEC